MWQAGDEPERDPHAAFLPSGEACARWQHHTRAPGKRSQRAAAAVSRSKPSGLAREPGEVYTLHFQPPYGDPEVQQAKHYTGWTRPGTVGRRLADHALGRGARLTDVQRRAGGSWILASVEAGTRDRESTLKERGASRRCGVCKAQRDYEAGKLTAAEALTAAGWDRFTPREKNLALQAFGLESVPEGLDMAAPPPPEPASEITLRTPTPAQFTPEQRAEMDALIDGLVAQWTAAPKGPQAQPEMELEAG
jgi:hypothetical protein